MYQIYDEIRQENRAENRLLWLSGGTLSTGLRLLFTLGFGAGASDEIMGVLHSSFTQISDVPPQNADKISVFELFAVFVENETTANPAGAKSAIGALDNLVLSGGGVAKYLQDKFDKGCIEALRREYSKNMADRLKLQVEFDDIVDEIDVFIKTHSSSTFGGFTRCL